MKAALFDIDGTLVDSNYLHVDAWSRAFHELEIDVEAWRVHRGIGMDSQKLLEELLGDRADELGERASEWHTAFYSQTKARLRPFAGARELVSALSDAGVTVVLATSAPESELEALRAVLKIEDSISVVTSSEDVSTAKPAPDIVQVALSKADVESDEAIMVGDSVWDVKAAAAAGVACIGVRSGGVSEAELRDAGAIAVYDDVADLLAKLSSSPLA
jgi:HAD superfamily hydrolase (TIGR01509 family)